MERRNQLEWDWTMPMTFREKTLLLLPIVYWCERFLSPVAVGVVVTRWMIVEHGKDHSPLTGLARSYPETLNRRLVVLEESRSVWPCSANSFSHTVFRRWMERCLSGIGGDIT